MDRLRVKSRAKSAPFVSIPWAVLDSPNFAKLSHAAVCMLIELARRFTGKNNGDLSATARAREPRGWNSNETITRALRELEHYGFIIRSRQGGRNRCNLYALSWHGVNECGGKLEISASPVPLNDWKIEKEPYRHPPRARSRNRPRRHPSANCEPCTDSRCSAARAAGAQSVHCTDSRCSPGFSLHR
jgi:hypothetical protein